MENKNIQHGIILLQSRIRGYLVRKISRLAYEQFCKINESINKAVNAELEQAWKSSTDTVVPHYDFQYGIDYFERDGVKFPLFIPVYDFLWKDFDAYQEIKRKQEELEKEQNAIKIKQLEEECRWIEDAILQRIEVRKAVTLKFDHI